MNRTVETGDVDPLTDVDDLGCDDARRVLETRNSKSSVRTRTPNKRFE